MRIAGANLSKDNADGEEMRVLEVTVVKNMDTGEEIILPREELDPEQFNRNSRAKFHPNCIAYKDMARVEEPSREEQE